MWDQQGKEYIDFAGGIAVNALGHAHPELREALNEQASKFWHTGNGYTNEPVLRLAKKLIDATFADRVFFCNSGAEANEAALKLARKFAHDRYGSHKSGIVAFKNAFHGRTLFTVSAGGQPAYSQDFAPLPADIRHAAYNDINSASALIDDSTCAVIVEPIQGEGGVVPASNAFLQGLRELCDRHNALLIFDEVQTGVGRTGELYACMHYGVTPDLLTTAKALGGGFPVGALLATEECARVMTVGTHGTTYGGNPLVTAGASAVFDIFEKRRITDHVKEIGAYLYEKLEELSKEFDCVRGHRGMGLIQGLEFSVPAGPIVSKALLEQRLVLISAGTNIIRFVPPLVIEKADVDEMMKRLRTCLKIAF